jgi:hypothetical protein
MDPRLQAEREAHWDGSRLERAYLWGEWAADDAAWAAATRASDQQLPEPYCEPAES